MPDSCRLRWRAGSAGQGRRSESTETPARRNVARSGRLERLLLFVRIFLTREREWPGIRNRELPPERLNRNVGQRYLRDSVDSLGGASSL